MYSAEGEMVQFADKLYPVGNVEDWLLEVEKTMKTSLREILYQALQEYGEVRGSCLYKHICYFLLLVTIYFLFYSLVKS